MGRILQVITQLLERVRSSLFQAYVKGLFFFSIIGFFIVLFAGFPYSILLLMLLTIPHLILCAKTSSTLIAEETDPYEVLRSQELILRTLLVSFTIFTVDGILATLINALPQFPYRYELYIFFGLSLFIALSILVVSFLYMVPFVLFLSTYRDARLCLHQTLLVLEACMNEPDHRYKILRRNSRFMKRAFEMLRDLLHSKHFRLDFKGSGIEFSPLYTVALVGEPIELNQISTEIRLLLEALGETRENIRLRETLVSLTRLISLDFDDDPTVSELSRTWQHSTTLQRVKSRLKSPLASTIVAIVFGIPTLIAIIPILLELVPYG